MACAVLVLAQAVYVTVGFGSGLIALGCLALLPLNLTDLVIALMLVSLPAEIYVVVRSWRAVAWREAGRICAGVVLGALAGTYLLVTSPPAFMLQVLAVLLMLAGVGLLASARALAVRWPHWTQVPVGLSSGVLAGMLGAGGPPLILYYRLAGVDKTAFRGNLMAIFFACTVVRLGAGATGGLLTAPRLGTALSILPAALLGLWFGKRWHARLSEAAFRSLVSIGLVAIGIALLFR
ncbi:MAG TPA: sulfite exporter TauE/SafE family protein [Polyangiaceae bacterium]|nr:sulfite exporter TauE/SafE family protein [Polyangiaceae bacterium]